MTSPRLDRNPPTVTIFIPVIAPWLRRMLAHTKDGKIRTQFIIPLSLQTLTNYQASRRYPFSVLPPQPLELNILTRDDTRGLSGRWRRGSAIFLRRHNFGKIFKTNKRVIRLDLERRSGLIDIPPVSFGKRGEGVVEWALG